jgi:hypothetical protein
MARYLGRDPPRARRGGLATVANWLDMIRLLGPAPAGDVVG